jgi:hypothetical protein
MGRGRRFGCLVRVVAVQAVPVLFNPLMDVQGRLYGRSVHSQVVAVGTAGCKSGHHGAEHDDSGESVQNTSF